MRNLNRCIFLCLWSGKMRAPTRRFLIKEVINILTDQASGSHIPENKWFFSEGYEIQTKCIMFDISDNQLLVISWKLMIISRCIIFFVWKWHFLYKPEQSESLTWLLCYLYDIFMIMNHSLYPIFCGTWSRC